MRKQKKTGYWLVEPANTHWKECTEARKARGPTASRRRNRAAQAEVRNKRRAFEDSAAGMHWGAFHPPPKTMRSQKGRPKIREAF